MNKIQELQNKIFGPALSDVPVELGLLMHHLESNFSKNKNLLTEIEQTSFQNYLHLCKIKPLVEPDPIIKSKSSRVAP